MLYTLPVVEPAKRTCDGCRECCIAYPLLPDAKLWPDGKRAHTPCKYLCDKGCSIHDQPRPAVCTGFLCLYLQGNYGPQYRPDRSGVILNSVNLGTYMGELMSEWRARIPGDWSDDDCCITMCECRPRALLALDPDKLRYGFRKLPWRCVVVMPYGVDVNHDAERKIRRNEFRNAFVWWTKTPDYAAEVIRWWGMGG